MHWGLAALHGVSAGIKMLLVDFFTTNVLCYTVAILQNYTYVQSLEPVLFIVKDRAVRKARRLLESRDVDEDLARVLRLMDYNITDLPDIPTPPSNKDKQPTFKFVHKKRKL